jgi:hypothetical protein
VYSLLARLPDEESVNGAGAHPARRSGEVNRERAANTGRKAPLVDPTVPALSAIAGVFFFDYVATWGIDEGVFGFSLEALRHVDHGASKIVTDSVVAAHLRTSRKGLRQLRAAGKAGNQIGNVNAYGV